jgi:hypothetical protein
MIITERQFYNVGELREMIGGFEALFGLKPEVRIVVIGPNGGPTGTRDHNTGDVLFFPYDGFSLEKIGNTYLTVRINSDETARIAGDNAVIYRARFYLP